MIHFGTVGLTLSLPVARALFAFTKDDPNAYRLSVGIDGGDVCATDGVGAVRFQGAEADPNGRSPNDWNRRHWARRYVEDIIKAAGRAGPVLLEWSALDVDAQFPRIGQVEPKDGAEVLAQPIGIDTVLLARLELVAKGCRRERLPSDGLEYPPLPSAVLTSIAGPLDAMRFTIGGPDQTIAGAHRAFVTLMPMRLAANAAPWRKPKAKTERKPRVKKTQAA